MALAFLRRGLEEALTTRVALLLRLVTVAFSLASLYFLSRFVGSAGGAGATLARYGGDYLSFALVGTVGLSLQYTVVAAYPQCVREAQLSGTLEAMLATPTPGWLVLLCSPLYRLTAAVLWAAAYLVAGAALFGVRLGAANLGSLALAVPLCLVGFAAVGFFGAALTMVLRRADPLSFALGGVSTLLGGVLYPTAVLPGWLQGLGRLLPITHALELVRRATFAGATPADLGSSLLGLALFCAVAAPLGLAAFGWTLRRARHDGSLSHF